MPTSLPASTDFTGAAVDEGDFKSAITALRGFLAGLFGTDGATTTALATLGSPLSSYVAKTGAYSAVAGDKGKTFDCSGTWTFGLLAAATAGDGFTIAIRNGGTGVITVDPNLSETVDGGATLAINASESLILYCNGTGWISIGKSSGVPSGSMTAYGGSSAPAGWLLCDGSAVSRTTYASLFSAISTAFGVGDGSTTFNLPDGRGRVLAGKDNMGGTAANRLTTAGSGVDGATLGAIGGLQTLVSHTHATASGNGSGSASSFALGYDVSGSLASGATGTGTGHGNVQPTLVCNHIIKT